MWMALGPPSPASVARTAVASGPASKRWVHCCGPALREKGSSGAGGTLRFLGSKDEEGLGFPFCLHVCCALNDAY